MTINFQYSLRFVQNTGPNDVPTSLVHLINNVFWSLKVDLCCGDAFLIPLKFLPRE